MSPKLWKIQSSRLMMGKKEITNISSTRSNRWLLMRKSYCAKSAKSENTNQIKTRYVVVVATFVIGIV
jgi:hypothetical protein